MSSHPDADLYEILEPILLRPAMWFGRKSIIAFGHFYFGLIHLGGCGHGGPFVFKMRNELFASGFSDWLYEKRGWAKNVVTWHHYASEARKQLREQDIAEPSTFQEEDLGFDLFVADLEEFKKIPRNWTWWQFMDRIDELKKEPEQGCLVYRCGECNHEGCWYEGVLTYLFKRLNEPCKCGSTSRTLHNGVGEEYEL